MDRTHSFGYWLRRRRKALDLTQGELAQRVSCSLDLIQKIEADARRPSRQLAEKLADSLGLDSGERTAFVQAARAERSADRLALPSQPFEQPVVALPQGTITFLFTDIEGSSRLWEQHPRAMPTVLARHDGLLNEIVMAHGGVIFKTVGDSVLAAFAQAPQALAAALAAQRAISTEAWELPEPPRVRMALHSGSGQVRDGDYFGPALNRAARLLAAGHGGQILLSLATEQLVREELPPDARLRDLGLHRLKDLSLPEQIFQLVTSDLPASFRPLNTLDARYTNLPTQPTALLGREQEVAAVVTLLRRSDVRLITLTGPGGVGKTRLSLQVAADLVDDFSQGVYFVDLAPIREPAVVIGQIAITLGVKEIGGQPLLATLKEYLCAKRILLLLDNFEQVLDAAPVVAELLAAAPQLKVLATSREILHLRGEKEVIVLPLALPNTSQLPPLDQLSQYAAVALFIERALDARSDFMVTNANAPAVAEICTRLDGLPLAIELAAARVKLFWPEALLARLSSRLALLIGGPRDLPARQQTLRTAIAWSYDLLNPTEQMLFRWLGVFVGGCSLEAVEAVCSDDDLGIDVLAGLTSLLDQSLLRKGEVGKNEPRFSMLETIREYALEQLQASGETTTLQQRHAAYYLALAETGAHQFRGAARWRRLARLEAEHDNLRTALEWSLGGGDVEMGVQLAVALGELWQFRGGLSEAHSWLASALAQSSAGQASRAKALHQAGSLAYAACKYPEAHSLFEESLILFRDLGRTQDVVDVLTSLAGLALDRGDHTRAAELFEESLALSRDIGDQGRTAWTLAGLGQLAHAQSSYPRAQALYDEALELFRKLDDTHGIGITLWALGNLARSQADDARAAACYDECLALAQEAGDKPGIASIRHNQSYLALHQGDHARAEALLMESLALSRETGSKHQIAWALAGLGGVAVAQGQPECAARLLGAAEEWFASVGHVLGTTERSEHDRYIAAARGQLDDVSFATAWAAGRAMTMEQAIAYALEGSDGNSETSIAST
jgi:predicted ATPase/class 3 adenylate cyclase